MRSSSSLHPPNRSDDSFLLSRYAKHLVDIFNKDQKIVQYCLAREYTTFVNDQEHYKDLSILNRDLVAFYEGSDG